MAKKKKRKIRLSDVLGGILLGYVISVGSMGIYKAATNHDDNLVYLANEYAHKACKAYGFKRSVGLSHMNYGEITDITCLNHEGSRVFLKTQENQKNREWAL